MKNIVLFMVVICMVSGTAFAQKNKAERREQRQEQRIQQGVESGQLTEEEAARLNEGQARIDEAQEQAASDGEISKKEKRHINQMQNVQSKKIRKQKHDKKCN